MSDIIESIIYHLFLEPSRQTTRFKSLFMRIYRFQNTSYVYYVESENSNDHYYAKFEPDVLESWYCSCKDNSTRRGLKCKHLWGIEFAIKWGTIKEIDKVPITVAAGTTIVTETDVKIDIQTNNIASKSTTVMKVSSAIGPKSYKDDEYTF
jgi:predicted nucleic acid-binding Zn finger protein